MADRMAGSQLIDELARLTEAIVNDYEKAQAGVKAANVRIRNNLICIRNLVKPARKHLMELRNTDAYNRDTDV